MRARPLAIACLSLVACKQRADASMPARAYDRELAPVVDEFLATARAFGRKIDGKVLDRLRIVAYVDDLVQKRLDYGQPAADGDDVAGTCTDAEVEDVQGIMKLRWKVTERHWSEVWIAASFKPRSADDRLILRELVFHELGHCLLGLEHYAGREHRIMSPSVSDDPQGLAASWAALTKELFTPRPN